MLAAPRPGVSVNRSQLASPGSGVMRVGRDEDRLPCGLSAPRAGPRSYCLSF